jgi:hypothetical protein
VEAGFGCKTEWQEQVLVKKPQLIPSCRKCQWKPGEVFIGELGVFWFSPPTLVAVDKRKY